MLQATMLQATRPSGDTVLLRAGASSMPDLLTSDHNLSYNGSVHEGPPYWSVPERSVFATVLSVILAVAVVGNVLVITVIVKNQGMRTRTNMFLCNLALADLFCAILDMPVSLVTIIHGNWVFSDAMCQFNGFALPFFFVASIHTLMYIGIHKYLSIRYPLEQLLTRSRVHLMMGAAWIWAALAGYLTVHGLNTVSYRPATAQCGATYPPSSTSSSGWMYGHLVFVVVSCYLVPLLILAGCYIGMFREIQALSRRLEQNTSMEKELISLQQRRITCTLLIVLLMFVICWTPFIIYLIISALYLPLHNNIHKYANPISYWCGYLSSAGNPLIYALMSPAFREGYRELVCQAKGEHIVSDGYSYYRRKRRPWSTISVCSNYYDKGSHPSTSQPFSQFRSFLQHHLGGTVQDSDSSAGSAPTSRKTSFTSIANFVLFPKSRTLSTNSLPKSFAYSASLPGRLQQQQPENNHLSLMTKLTKMLSFNTDHCEHHTQGKTEVDSARPAVYYPPTTHPNTDIKIQIETVEEVEEGVSDFKGPMAMEQQEPYEIEVTPLLENRARVAGLPECPVSKPHVMTVRADVVPARRGVVGQQDTRVSSSSTASPPAHHTTVQLSGVSVEEEVFACTDTNDSTATAAAATSGRQPSQLVSASATDKRHSLFGDTLTVPDETRQWFSKSLSDEGKSGEGGQVLDKSTSDTCIVGQKPSSTDNEQQQERAVKRNIFKRLFSRSSSSTADTDKKHRGDSLTSMLASSDTVRRSSGGILKKYLRSVSADPTRSNSHDVSSHIDGNQRLCYQSQFPHRSASDPALMERKKSRWKKIKSKYSLKRKNKRKNSGSESHRYSLEGFDFGRLIRSKSERSAGVNVMRYPSIEKLDTMNDEYVYHSYRTLHSGTKKKLLDERSVSQEVMQAFGTTPEPPLPLPQAWMSKTSQGLESQRTRVLLYRSASDPNMTFQMIEDKVMQRVAVKQWARKHKSSKTADLRSKSVHICP